MKKAISTFFLLLICSTSFSVSFAESVDLNTTSTWITSTWLTSTWEIIKIEENSDLINTGSEISETSYIYYYGQWCSHCANLDKYFKWVWAYEKLNITKKEVYFDDKNRQEMMDEWKRLWLNESEIWVPFFIINESWVETPLIWDGPVIEKLKPTLWEVPENKNKTIIFTILIVLAIIIPVFLIKLSNKN